MSDSRTSSDSSSSCGQSSSITHQLSLGSCGCSNSGKRRASRLAYNPEWKQRFFMWPVDHPLDSTQDDEMICMLCCEVMKAKCSTAARHQDRKHANSKTFTRGKRLRIIKLFESNRKKQQATMKRAVEPQYFTKLAPFKLAFVINKHKMPFSSCQAFIEFAANADPNSCVFPNVFK